MAFMLCKFLCLSAFGRVSSAGVSQQHDLDVEIRG